jgi:hypothetical protein
MSCPCLKQAALLLLPVIIVTSCQKELSNPDPEVTCTLSKITYYDTSGLADSAALLYSNDHIGRINAVDYFYTFRYTNSRVSRIDYYENNGTSLGLFDSVVYDGSGNIQSVTFYSAGFGPWLPIGGYDLFFNSDGSLSKVIEKYMSTSPGILINTYEYNYIWSQGNITQVVSKDLTLGFTDTLHYTFDNTANYYQKFPAEFIFADTYLFGITGFRFGAFAPFLYSQNNVSMIGSLTVSYGHNSRGNFSQLKVEGTTLAAYDYTCN